MQQLNYLKNRIVEDLEIQLNKLGVFYRIFSRVKSMDSFLNKINKDKTKYSKNGKKIQDIIGIRIVFYFMDDIKFFKNLFLQHQLFDNCSDSIDELKHTNIPRGKPEEAIFQPTILNIVLRMNNEYKKLLNEALLDLKDENKDLIDETYEIQLRSVLSEGWHEVEHDLRYKRLSDPYWQYCIEESRMLNGIYATLETSERAMGKLFDNIAYKNYQQKDWEAMCINHIKIRFANTRLQPELVQYLSQSNSFAKLLLRSKRSNLFDALLKMQSPLPLTLQNIILLINRTEIGDLQVIAMENESLKIKFDSCLERNLNS